MYKTPLRLTFVITRSRTCAVGGQRSAQQSEKVAEACYAPVPVRVQVTTADPITSQVRHCGDKAAAPIWPRDCGGVVQRVIELDAPADCIDVMPTRPLGPSGHSELPVPEDSHACRT